MSVRSSPETLPLAQSPVEPSEAERQRSRVIEAIYRALPYSNQIRRLDVSSESGAVRFEWRGAALRVSVIGGVEEVEGSFLVGSNLSILASALIKQALARPMSEGQ